MTAANPRDVVTAAARLRLNPRELMPEDMADAARVLDWSYYNADGTGIAVVAVQGFASDDWAAYIGALPGSVPEGRLVLWTVRHGAKLSEDRALAWFAGRGAPWGLAYRE